MAWPVLAVAAALVAVLLALSGSYGFHGDEMYFIVAGRHPAFGYPDQPPLTPLLSAASVGLLGVTPTAVRILPALEMGAIVLLAALIAREFGGSRRAQVLAAVVTALSGYLGAGHLDSTSAFDLFAWALILWLLAWLLAGGDRRQWLLVGAVAGLALENKDTPLLLAGGLGVGLILARRWDVLRSRWAWSAIGIALLLWLPNLAWQGANGWPQVTMAGHISGDAADNRAQLLPVIWLAAGMTLFPVAIAGLWRLALGRESRQWRPIAWGSVVVVALVFASGGKGYYAVGTVPAFMAAGSITLDGWLARGRLPVRGTKWTAFVAAAAVSALLTAYLTLPILPLADYAKTTLPSQVPDTASQVGWPEYVSQVDAVVRALPAGELAHAAIVTYSYSQASAIELLGDGAAPVYSGHNAWWEWGPPAPDRTTVVLVGDWFVDDGGAYFTGCEAVAHLHNQYGVPNQDEGQAIEICTGLRAPWTVIWPSLRHLE